MGLTLKQKIIALPLIAGILPVLLMFIVIYMEKADVRSNIKKELDLLGRESMERTALDLQYSCQLANDMALAELDRKLEEAWTFFDQMGGLSLTDKSLQVKTVNQFDGKEKPVSLPDMLVQGLNEPGTYLQLIKKKFGGDYGLFERMNEQGDMVLVGTTKAGPTGSPGIGTYIPATQGDAHNPIIKNILEKRFFHGLAYIVDGWRFCACKALTDDQGKVIGMLYTGIPYKTPEILRKAIIDMKVGKTGYVWVLGAKNPDQRGHYIISKGGERDSEDLWKSKDATGRLFVQSIVNKALSLKKGEVGYERYSWKNPGEAVDRWKTSSFTYFEPWDWVIAVGAYEDDYYDARRKVESTMLKLQWVILISGLVVLVLVVGLAFIMGAKVARPITRITGIAKQISTGDLSTAAASVESLVGSDGKGISEDETGHLLGAIRSMTKGLNSLIGQVQRSGIQVTSSSTELAATAKEQEATMGTQMESTRKVVKSVEEISDVATDLVETMQQVASMSQETAGFASSGQADLARMEEAMRSMENASKSISGRLSTINEKAENITNVVITITKVADQTNLLSLNAAIEAEKAGEYGRGFNVVAREIRRLADQTAVATLDIDQMVREMQSAVSAGVMEMDKFIAEVKHSAEDVGKISGQLTRIIEQVQALSPSFDDVNVAMGHQSENAQKISSAMGSLSEEMQQTTDSIRETYSAIEQLNEAAKGLQDEVSRFKVDREDITHHVLDP
jgi:methyl-accepting chemotaxis protein